jgi:hypothetical protein
LARPTQFKLNGPRKKLSRALIATGVLNVTAIQTIHTNRRHRQFHSQSERCPFAVPDCRAAPTKTKIKPPQKIRGRAFHQKQTKTLHDDDANSNTMGDEAATATPRRPLTMIPMNTTPVKKVSEWVSGRAGWSRVDTGVAEILLLLFA